MNTPAQSDELMQQISWEPLIRGGTSWRTHKIKQDDDQLHVIPTRAEQWIGWLILAASAAALCALPLVFRQQQTGLFLFILIAAPLFGLMGYAMARSVKKLTFDRFRGIYYQGERPDDFIEGVPEQRKKPFFRITEYGHDKDIREMAQGRIADIAGLQIVEEKIRTRSHQGTRLRTMISHELNLVLHNGTRLNVMDHGNQSKFSADAVQISDFLGVRLWQRSADGLISVAAINPSASQQ